MKLAAVDPHVHLLPARRTETLMRWLLRALPDVGIPADITAERSLADLRAAGARRVVNLLFPLKPGEADELHAFGRALSDREPDVVPVGGVHAEDSDPEAVIRRAIEDHGMRGMKLHPMVQRFSPGHPGLAPAIAALEEYRLPLYVHTGFDEWYGWGYDLGELEAIAERHPGVPLVLCHCAFPRLEWAGEMARRFPQVWLDTTNVFATIDLLPGDQAADRLAAVGALVELAPERIFFGTDYPAAMGTLDKLHASASRALGELGVAEDALHVNAETFVSSLV
jgi:predicted TIM-barrel fold metal-dependent hydrolase